MKKIIILTLLISTVVVLPIFSHAAVSKLANNYTLARGEAVTQNLYLASKSAVFLGNVSRDLTAVASRILFSGRVGGDFLSASGSLDFSGETVGDARILAGDLNVVGSTGGDLLAAAGETRLVSGSRVTGDAVLATGRLVIDGEIDGNLLAAAGEVVINGRVGGAVSLWAERITLGERAVIGGDFTYRSKSEAILQPGAIVRGKTTFQPVNDGPTFSREALAGLLSGWRATMLLALILAILVWFKLAPRSLDAVARAALTRPGRSALLALAGLIGGPVLVLVLFISIIGWPLAFLTALTYLQVLILARILAGALVGLLLFKLLSRSSGYQLSWQAVVAGPAALFVLGRVPFLGPLLVAVFFLLAFGALIYGLWRVFLTQVPPSSTQ